MNNDPFFSISSQKFDGSWVLVYRSEICNSTNTPQWDAFNGPLAKFTDDENDGRLLIQVYDHRRNGGHVLIGEIQTTIQQLVASKGKNLALVNEAKANSNPGILSIEEFSVERKFTFYEYISGGAHINLSVAIDLSSSNGDPKNPQSLHYQNPRESNQYQRAIMDLGNILERYDQDKLFPVFGFGAKSNDAQSTHLITLCERATGIKGVLEAYNQALLTVQPSEPTYLSQVIDEACSRLEYDLAQARRTSSYIQHYHVLLIITDGNIDDMENTIGSIIRASELPLSIIIAGVGFNDFTNMEVLDSDEKILTLNGQTAKRDIVQFVPLNQFQGLNSHKLTRAVLTEIPDQFMEYMNNQQIPPPKQRLH
ncbi:Copine-domain-containing protein [Basidiobolus meristosporus CBS 931.73]|uniref:Copine-domain-containing protein n=1 Tax=Basidiobolus meristosporus CBS 931.73 TaxID=1314790 RepID=A0A1Y1Z9H2_9FUNG|nr:Copine-domain-containing protein [Basidiobolus meristosporus CBS 931.73]|eukprot:ORY06425.1 Copine-domain-containing protein [Basidiobolus meristosporus CBS 931.73]